MRSLGLACSLLVLPMTVHAQATSCLSLSAPPKAAAPGYAVHVLSAFAQGEDVTVLGWPAYDVRRDSAGEHRVVDSLFAGIVVRASGSTQKVPVPFPGRSFEEPWLIRLSDRSARLLFLVSVPRREPISSRDSIEIWTGTLGGTHWSELTHVMTVGGMARLHSQSVPAVFRNADSVLFAFGETRQDSRVDGLTFLTATNDKWLVERDTTLWRWIDYVDLTQYHDTLWMAAIGMSRAVERASGWSSNNSVYVSRQTRSGWSEPVRIADGTTKNLHEPRLHRQPEGLYVSWWEYGHSGRLLHVRGLTAGTDTATHVSVIQSRLTPGSGAWRDILTFTTDDTTGVIARPGPGGLAEVGRLRVSQRLPPLVVSGPRGPIAVTLTPTPDDPELSVVSIFDLRCALGPARPDPYRR